MATENDLLKDAIIGTEREIFAEGFGKEDTKLDETGDRSQEAMGDGLEGQVEPEDEDDAENPDESDEGDEKDTAEEPDKTETEVDAKATEQKATEAQPEPQGRVPAGRLREEAEARRKAETDLAAVNARLETVQRTAMEREAAILAAFQRMQQGQPVKPADDVLKTPDLFEDPVAFADHIKRGVVQELTGFRQQMRDQEINTSLAVAAERHGKVFNEAWTALASLPKDNPDNVALVRRMEASPNPGETVVAWHKRNQALREVGDDITSYRAKVAEDTRKELMADPEFRKELLASLRGEAMTGDQGRPRTQVRFPKALSNATGNGADRDTFDGSEQATFSSAWST